MKVREYAMATGYAVNNIGNTVYTILNKINEKISNVWILLCYNEHMKYAWEFGSALISEWL